MKIFITGAAGYIGSVLTGRLLEEGWEVIALDNLMYNQTSLFQYCNNDNFKFIRADVREIVNFPNCDVFLPLASITGPACEKNPESSDINTFHYKNLKIPANLKIIFPMTNSGYGTTTGEVHCTEKSLLQPISAYVKQKVATEDFLFENFSNVTSLRLATVGFRPGVAPRSVPILRPRDRPVFAGRRPMQAHELRACRALQPSMLTSAHPSARL